MLSSASTPTVATARTNMSRRPSVPYLDLDLPPGEATERRNKRKRDELHDEALALLEHFSRKNSDALVQATRLALEKLRRALTPPVLNYSGQPDDKEERLPVLKVLLELSIPNLVVKPNLDSVQCIVNDVVQYIVCTHKQVYQWGENRESSQLETVSLTSPSQGGLTAPSQVLRSSSLAQVTKKPRPLKNFHRLVSEHKDVIKLVTALSSIITAAKNSVTESYVHFNVYQDLWKSEQSEKMTEFVEQDPSLGDFEGEMRCYEALEDTIMSENDQITVGAFLLDCCK